MDRQAIEQSAELKVYVNAIGRKIALNGSSHCGYTVKRRTPYCKSIRLTRKVTYSDLVHRGGASNFRQGDDFSSSLSPAPRQGSGNFPIPTDSLSVPKKIKCSAAPNFQPCISGVTKSIRHIQINRNAADRFEPGYNAEPRLIIDSGVAGQSARQQCRIETPDSGAASFGA